MAIVADPCRDFHPEMALLLEITALNERLPQFLCNRCGSRLGFEEAIRNDERLKVAARVAELERRLDRARGACDEAIRISSEYGTSVTGTILAKVVLAWLAGLELAKPVLLDVSRDPQQHPRDETGRYVQGGERG